VLTEESISGVAVVIGAGTMGSGIAADLVNAGWEVHLLDVTAERAAAGLKRITQHKPPLLFWSLDRKYITPGSMAEAAEPLARADWVVEAVAENMTVKRDVLSLIEAHVGSSALITSNTSGLGLSAMSAHTGPDFRRRFFGTHFLNPPRYLKLLEVIPTPDTDTEILAGFVRFAEQVMGHRVVVAKDTPGFISTRLWITHLLDTIHTAFEQGVDVETVDALTGPFLGRPKSATFRMADLVGLDIIAAVAKNQYDLLPDDPLRERLRLPEIMETLLASGRLGEKSGAGFYRREGKAIQALDLTTGEYRPRRDVSPDLSNRAQKVFTDTILNRLFDYARAIRPEIAESEGDVDRVMRWGFGWEQGPFEMAAVRNGTLPPVEPHEPEYVTLDDLRLVATYPTSTLRDMGDGVLCLELHAKMNTFSPAMCEAVVTAIERVEQEAKALVIAGRGPHFSAGYDLARLVTAMERGDLPTIDTEMKACQDAFMRAKYARVPVVAAVQGYTLGAGCELAMHCAAIVTSPELYMGLPEMSVGVIPCGGGIKELWNKLGDPGAVLKTIVLNQNSTSAWVARETGYLQVGHLCERDFIVRNADRLLFEAKQVALQLAEGYVTPPSLKVQGPVNLAPVLAELHESGDLTEHDRFIAGKVAEVLSTDGTEQALLDAERRVFLELCQESKSIERMRHMLTTGKPLKN
jgi:3-hydroxyacyl-CoA dehydrogenase